MHTSVPDALFELDALIAYLLEHRKQYPEHGRYHVEMRDHLLAAPPQHLTHDDRDRVVILLGYPSR